VGALDSLFASSEMLVGAGGLAFKLRRMRSVDLMRLGLIELLGKGDAVAALKSVQEEMGLSPKKTEEVKAAERESFTAWALKTPERLGQLVDMSDATVCASVVAIGFASVDGVIEDALNPEGPEGDGRPVWDLEPVELVMKSEDDDRAKGRTWVGRLPDAVRGRLSSYAQKLTSSELEVRPL